jgi:succinate dehydrogenase/fumarate reductase flavoprotein subunit
MSPVGNSIYMRHDRLESALGKILDLKTRASGLRAKDWQYLSACNEVTSMLISAEMFFRAAMERKESRGWYIREDYPQMDNKSWLKWTVIQNREGEMTVSGEDVPIGKYSVKP